MNAGAGDAEGPLVLVTDYDFADLEPERAMLAPLGVRLVAHRRLPETEIALAAAGAEAILTQWCRIDAETISALRKCRVIVRYGVGFDSVDVAAAARAGIPVCNVPDYCTEEVALHTVALILACARRIWPLHASVLRGEWAAREAGRGIRRFSAQCVGIVGFGRIGRSVAGKAAALGATVLAHDPLIPGEAMVSAGAQPCALETLLQESDYVTLHAPLGTGRIIGLEELTRMKRGAFLINTARGGLVDEPALIESLDAGHLAGAALDVLSVEPPLAGHRLLGRLDVLITAHAAFYSEEAQIDLQRGAAAAVVAALSGLPLPHVVNGDMLVQ